MRRNVYDKIVAWHKARKRKPLVLMGARQVGKTWLMEHFAAEYYPRLLWNNPPAQLAKENKKFIYTALREGARAREYEEASNEN